MSNYLIFDNKFITYIAIWYNQNSFIEIKTIMLELAFKYTFLLTPIPLLLLLLLQLLLLHTTLTSRHLNADLSLLFRLAAAVTLRTRILDNKPRTSAVTTASPRHIWTCVYGLLCTHISDSNITYRPLTFFSSFCNKCTLIKQQLTTNSWTLSENFEETLQITGRFPRFPCKNLAAFQHFQHHSACVSASDKVAAVPVRRNGNFQTPISVPAARPKRCHTLSNPAHRQDYMVACLNYTLQTMMPLPGWPVMAPNAYDNNNNSGVLDVLQMHM